ncbi:MAG: DUF3999 family protein [bacterium]|nr:DUF3999 family protein [bacterium]
MKKYFLLIALLFIPVAFIRADFTVAKWQHERPITLPSLGGSEYVRLKLDRAVAAGSTGYKDVRVLQGNREVPYQFSAETAEIRAQYLSSQVIDTVVDSAGRLQFILDVGKNGTLHSRIHIEIDSKNYKRQVSVFASANLLPHSSASWNLLTDKGYIFKFSDPVTKFTTDSGEVPYPQNTSRYLRVVIENGPEGALSLTSGSVFRYEISSAKEETETLPADVLQKKENQTTEVIFDLGAAGIPTNKVTLSIADRGNFSRSAHLFGSVDATSWSRVGQGYLSAIDTPKFIGSNLSIEYPESTYRYYKVSVQNFDDAHLQIGNKVEVTHIIRTVVFEATPNTAYTLYYGNPLAYTPQYDLSRYFEYLETTSLPEARLGVESVNPEYVAPLPPVVPFTDRNKVLLNVTLALLCLIIAAFVFWYIWRHARHGGLAAAAGQPSTPVPPIVPPPPSQNTEPPQQQ